MRRRAVLAGLAGAATWQPGIRAQPTSRVYRIGFLRIGAPPPTFLDPFRQGLRDLGYVEGQNLQIEFGLVAHAEQLPQAAAALVRRVDLIVASGAAAVLPARDAARGRPVVFVAGIDPVGTGLADGGLAQPGANVTGLTTVQIDLTAKRMHLLNEIVPSPASIAFLVRDGNPGITEYVSEAERAARALDVRLHVISSRTASDFKDAFERARSLGAEALVPMDDASFTAGRRQLVEWAERYRLPGAYAIREFVVEGGLMSLGPAYPAVYRRAAAYVDKILKGASPADLPVEQPTSFEIVVNLKCAAKLDLTIPPALLARADEVIE